MLLILRAAEAEHHTMPRKKLILNFRFNERDVCRKKKSPTIISSDYKFFLLNILKWLRNLLPVGRRHCKPNSRNSYRNRSRDDVNDGNEVIKNIFFSFSVLVKPLYSVNNYHGIDNLLIISGFLSFDSQESLNVFLLIAFFRQALATPCRIS